MKRKSQKHTARRSKTLIARKVPGMARKAHVSMKRVPGMAGTVPDMKW